MTRSPRHETPAHCSTSWRSVWGPPGHGPRRGLLALEKGLSHESGETAAGQGWGQHSSVAGELSGSGADRVTTAHQGDAVAREGNRHRYVARRTARDDAEGRSLLGDRIRLGEVRGKAECAPALHDRDRWAGHPLYPRSFEAGERAATHRHSRMARLDHRAAEDHRPSDQSHGTRWERIGRLRPGDPVDARLRVLG